MFYGMLITFFLFKIKSFSLSVIMVGWLQQTKEAREWLKSSDSKIIHNLYQQHNNAITLNFLNLLTAHDKNLKVDVSTKTST